MSRNPQDQKTSKITLIECHDDAVGADLSHWYIYHCRYECVCEQITQHSRKQSRHVQALDYAARKSSTLFLASRLKAYS
jgi:hypothetical protein